MAKKCPRCEGTGNCPRCDGSGTIEKDGINPTDEVLGTILTGGLIALLPCDSERECPTCDGSGICPRCEGSGEID